MAIVCLEVWHPLLMSSDIPEVLIIFFLLWVTPESAQDLLLVLGLVIISDNVQGGIAAQEIKLTLEHHSVRLP